MNDTRGSTVEQGGADLALAVIHAAQAIGDELEGALDEVGLSVAKQTALTRLAEAGEPLTLSDLAARLACVRSNITQLVDRLEADGLVRRMADPHDRRSIRAELTELGIERQAAGAERMADVHTKILGRMPAGRVAELRDALNGLRP